MDMEKRTKPETEINSKKTEVMEEYFQAKNGKELITADIVDILDRILRQKAFLAHIREALHPVLPLLFFRFFVISPTL